MLKKFFSSKKEETKPSDPVVEPNKSSKPTKIVIKSKRANPNPTPLMPVSPQTPNQAATSPNSGFDREFSELKELIQENKELNKKLLQLELDKKEVDLEINSLKQKNADKDNHISALSSQLAESAKKEELQNLKEEKEALSLQFQMLSKAVTEKDASIADLKAQIANSINEEDFVKLQGSNQQLVEQLDKGKKHTDQLNKDIQELASQIVDIKKSKEELKASMFSQEIVDELNDKIALLQEEKENLDIIVEAMKIDYEEVIEEAKVTKELISNIKQEKNELLHSLANSASSEEIVDAKLAVIQESLDKMIHEKSALEKTLESTKNDVSKLKQELSDSEKAHERTQKEKEKLLLDLDDEKNTIIQLNKDKEDILNQKRAVEEGEAVHLSKIEEIQNQLEEEQNLHKKSIEKLESKIKHLNNDVSQANEDKIEYQDKYDTLRSEWDDKIADMEKEIRDTKIEVTELKKEIVQLEEEKKEIENIKDNEEEEFNAKINSLQEKMSVLADSIEKSEQEKINKKESNLMRENQLQTLLEENESLKNQVKQLQYEVNHAPQASSYSDSYDDSNEEFETYNIIIKLKASNDEFEVELPGNLTTLEIIDELKSAEVLEQSSTFELLIERTNEIMMDHKSLVDCEIRQDEVIIIEEA